MNKISKQTKKVRKPIKKDGEQVSNLPARPSTPVGGVTLLKPLILFIISFSIVGVSVLGLHWYGTRLAAVFQRNMAKLISKKAPVNSPIPLSNGAYFDPLDLVQVIKKGDTSVVFLDVRSNEEYKKEHLKGAISAPLYFAENGQIHYQEVQSALQKVKIDRSKQIVVYGPSSSFQRQQEVVTQLKRNGYAAKQLAVGWNELRHFQNIWIPEPLWGKIDVNSLINAN